MSINKYSQNENFSDTIKLNSKEVKTGTKGAYLELMFIDQDLSYIPAKIWEASDGDQLEVGKVYEVNGVVQIYRNNHQLIVKELKESNSISSESFDECPLTESELKEELDLILNKIKDPLFLNLFNTLINLDIFQSYSTAKAAKQIHHAFERGLIYHSITMAKIADALCNIYPYLNRDLLLSASLIHDMGKILELNDTDYTDLGLMEGHIIIINDYLAMYSRKIKDKSERKKILHLKHIILSHHGKLEWGSPVLGVTPESIIFPMIDKMDADLMVTMTALRGLEPGERSKKLWVLDNRTLIKQ